MFFCFKQKTAYEMRISDWSSDVCSSDLRNDGHRNQTLSFLPIRPCRYRCRAGPPHRVRPEVGGGRKHHLRPFPRGLIAGGRADRGEAQPGKPDRKSGEEGKRVSGRVELGGRRILEKKKKKEKDKE